MIDNYTAENGVRELERKLGAICRNVAYQYVVSKERKEFPLQKVDKALVKDCLGPEIYD